MQIQKDEIRNRILAVASREFINNGVKHTSIKTIASKANVAVGNVYNYYKGKDDLLRAVLAPLFTAFKDYHNKSISEEYVSIDIFHNQVYYDMMYQQVASLIIPFRKELYMLIFETAGTSLENDFDRLLETAYSDGIAYLANIKNLSSHINTNISPHFVRIMCGLWASVIRYIVTHEGLTEVEINGIITDYVNFGMGGWRKLIGIE
jgi:transcriptional regulator, tetR family